MIMSNGAVFQLHCHSIYFLISPGQRIFFFFFLEGAVCLRASISSFHVNVGTRNFICLSTFLCFVIAIAYRCELFQSRCILAAAHSNPLLAEQQQSHSCINLNGSQCTYPMIAANLSHTLYMVQKFIVRLIALLRSASHNA